MMASAETPAPPAAGPEPMSGADRLLAACARRPVDATPVWFMRQAGRALPDYRRLRARHDLLTIARTPELAVAATLMPVDQLGVDGAVLFADIMLPLAGMGIPFAIRPGSGPIVPEPIRSAADVRRVDIADPDRATPFVLEAVRTLRQTLGGRAAVIGFAGGPFTLACYCVEGQGARDFPRARALLHGEPDTFGDLMGRLTETTIRYCVAQAAAGAQVIQLFESWVGVLARPDFERHVAPHLARIVDALRDRVPLIIFATGAAHLLPALAALGSPGIGLDWRVPLDEGWAQVGFDRFVQGNLDPAVLLNPFPVVATATAAVLRRAGGRPGHIFNLGHGVDPATDPDILHRLVDHVHAFRWDGGRSG